jgi:hypothetical protein
VSPARLTLSRPQILAFRRRVGALDTRLPARAGSLRRAAWAGLQDSMPRAALLSIHARVGNTRASSWEAPGLVQIWGPRYSTYVVPASDVAVFTLGRMPADGPLRRRAEDLAARLAALLDGRRMAEGEAARAIGERPNLIRYATLTGRVAIRWDGARAPAIWTLPPPQVEPRDARLELARRYLHVFGPATPEAFARWAGIGEADGRAAFEALRRALAPVRTPVGDAWILGRDEAAIRAAPGPPAPARLLPSGDAYYLLQGADRALLVANASQRAALWTSRVWPGALLVDGEVVGTWRRSAGQVTVTPWQRLARTAREAIEMEAATLPLPDLRGSVVVRWDARASATAGSA